MSLNNSLLATEALLQSQDQDPFASADANCKWNLPVAGGSQFLRMVPDQTSLQNGSPVVLGPLMQPMFPLYSLQHHMALADANRAQLIRMMLFQEQENQIRSQYQRLTAWQSAPTLAPAGPLFTVSQKNDSAESAYTSNLSSAEVLKAPALAASTLSQPSAISVGDVKAREKETCYSVPPSFPKKKDVKWLAIYEHLKAYKESHGDCIVPRGYSADPRLASWVAEQRKQYKLLLDGKLSSITPERVKLLQDLGFAWNAQAAAWTRHLNELIQFKKRTGHCHVPLQDPEYPGLGLWVKEQRRHRSLMIAGKPSHMTPNRAAELDRHGFCWDTHEATWLERFKELIKFKEKHGHCVVPVNNSDSTRLHAWVHHQRRAYRLAQEGRPSHITEKRIKALESLGFVWYPRGNSQRDGESSSSCASDSSATATSDRRPQADLGPQKRRRLSSTGA